MSSKKPPKAGIAEALNSVIAETMQSAMASLNSAVQPLVAFQKKAEEAKLAAELLLKKMPELDLNQAEEFMRQNPPNAYVVLLLIELAKQKAKTDTARAGAIARASKTVEARETTRKTWNADRTEYKSKMDFARIQVALLRNDGIRVSERQIASEWLKNL